MLALALDLATGSAVLPVETGGLGLPPPTMLIPAHIGPEPLLTPRPPLLDEAVLNHAAPTPPKLVAPSIIFPDLPPPPSK